MSYPTLVKQLQKIVAHTLKNFKEVNSAPCIACLDVASATMRGGLIQYE